MSPGRPGAVGPGADREASKNPGTNGPSFAVRAEGWAFTSLAEILPVQGMGCRHRTGAEPWRSAFFLFAAEHLLLLIVVQTDPVDEVLLGFQPVDMLFSILKDLLEYIA